MQSGLIYFKDWNTGTQTYRDPRQGKQPNSSVATAQRIGLLSISLFSHDTTSAVETKSTTPTNNNNNNIVVDEAEEAAATPAKKFKRKAKQAPQEMGFPWSLTMGTTTTTTTTTTCNPSHHDNIIIITDEDSTDREYNGPETSLSMENNNNNNEEILHNEQQQLQGDHDQSLDLSLQLPGMSRSRTSSQQMCQSVCTVEKVRSALERSQWLMQTPNGSKKRPSGSSSSGQLTNTLSTSLSLLSPRPSSSRESNSPGPQSPKPSQAATDSSPSTSQCSDSECFTSPSAMSYQGA